MEESIEKIRITKFRGRRIDTDEWVFGGLIETNCGHVGISLFTKYADRKIECIFCEVNPNTVGQFTGMKDKNGNKIYEFDVVRNKWGGIGIIVFFNGGWAIEWGEDEIHILFDELDEDIEVIGNKFDNPELLKI